MRNYITALSWENPETAHEEFIILNLMIIELLKLAFY